MTERQSSSLGTSGGEQAEAKKWVYINGLGERNLQKVTNADVLTDLKFDKTGEYLAVGDNDGRIIIFRHATLKNSKYFDYKFFHEF